MSLEGVLDKKNGKFQDLLLTLIPEIICFFVLPRPSPHSSIYPVPPFSKISTFFLVVFWKVGSRTCSSELEKKKISSRSGMKLLRAFPPYHMHSLRTYLVANLEN